MQTTPGGWNVIDREAGVLSLTYSFKKDAVSTTFVATMPGRKLVVVSPAKNVSDAALAELAEFGTVVALVANNGFHHLGQAEWRKRFPEARCFAPPEAIARIKKKNPAAGNFEPLDALANLTGSHVGFRVVPNSRVGESWFWAKTAAGYAWYLSDVLINLPKLPPFPIGLLFKWTHSAPGLRPFGLALKFVVKDKAATLRLLRQDLAAHPPTEVIPGHGDIVARAGIAQEIDALLASAS